MNEYLKHYAKGSESDKHSYTKREFINGKWVYYYGDGGMNQSTNAQQKIKDAGNSAIDKVKNDFNRLKSDVQVRTKFKKYDQNASKTIYGDKGTPIKIKSKQSFEIKKNFKGSIQKGKEKINSIMDTLKKKWKNRRF